MLNLYEKNNQYENIIILKRYFNFFSGLQPLFHFGGICFFLSISNILTYKCISKLKYTKQHIV